jgi:hypothetical protein
MKAFTGLLAVLLLLSCASLAQTSPAQPTQQTAPTQPMEPTQPSAPAQPTEASQQTTAAQPTEANQPAAPTQQAVAGGESSKPEAAGQEAAVQPSTPSPSATASTPSTEADGTSTGGASAGDVPAVPAAPTALTFAPGAKIFLEPMDGFEQLLARAILKRKVPVVLVHDRAEADFVMSGTAHVKMPGWFAGWVLDTRGKGNISIVDVRTGNLVFAHKIKRADANLTQGQIYQGWADGCASDLKKALTKKKSGSTSSSPDL